jgi:hypothetical protein
VTALAIGPEFGTVGPELIREAAKKAMKVADLVRWSPWTTTDRGTVPLPRLGLRRRHEQPAGPAAEVERVGGPSSTSLWRRKSTTWVAAA